MRTIETSVEAGPDKILRLEIPVDKANERYELVVVIDGARRKEGDNWPEGFFERFAGCIDDERFERPDQGEFTQREPLE
jgi:hypothetical protein